MVKPAPLTIFFFLLLKCGNLFGQEDVWDVYMAKYEKGAGTTVLNMSLKAHAPFIQFPFLVITGVGSPIWNNGLPGQKDFQKLYAISDSVKQALGNSASSILAGTFTYNGERLDFYYVSDTIGLREKLIYCYQKNAGDLIPVVRIKADEKWENYLQFLYPNEETQEYMSNEKILLKLNSAGDDLTKERKVDHWLYFSSENDRKCFIQYATQLNFAIESHDKIDRGTLPYQLQISRIEKLEISSISQLTLALRKQAILCKGEYDGWEIFVITK